MVNIEKLYQILKSELLCGDSLCDECLRILGVSECPDINKPGYKEVAEQICDLLELEMNRRNTAEISDSEFINLLFNGGE